MKYISLNWTLALKFSIGKKKRMRDCRILMAHDCISEIKCNKNCCLCQFSNDSDYVFSISIIDIT